MARTKQETVMNKPEYIIFIKTKYTPNQST